jgi:hypothetical protein
MTNPRDDLIERARDRILAESRARVMTDDDRYVLSFSAAKAFARAALAVVEEQAWRPTHRHKKRGSEYEIVSRSAQIQCPADWPLTDYELAVVYKGRDGRLWVRRRSEFDDGRVELIAPPTTEGGET